MTSEISGLVAAGFSPMNADGSIDLARVEPLARMLVGNGVSGVFINGSTGESLSLTIAERRALAERWIAAVGGRLATIVHVGHNCLAYSKELAAHAAEIGADAIAVMPPNFFEPQTIDDLVACVADVAAAVPEMPVFYYHIPVRTGVRLPMIEFLEAAGERIQNLCGLKYTHEDLADLGRCADHAGGRYTVLFGRDQMLLAGLAVGAAGAVGSTYNLAAPLYLQVINGLATGDLAAAQAAQARSRAMARVLLRHGGLPAFKATIKLMGMDVGNPRLPLRTLSDDAREVLRTELDSIGFFDYCSKT